MPTPMKVAIFPQFKHPDKGDGGIRRVVEAQHRHLPSIGMEIVEDIETADVVFSHAGDVIETDKPVVNCNHGIYWTAENPNWDKWAWELNRQVIRAMKRADVVTAPSHWVGHALSRGMLLDPIVVYHGVNADEWGVGQNNKYVLFNKSRVDIICDPSPVMALASVFPKQKFISTYGQTARNLQVIGRLPYHEMKPLVQDAGVYLATTRETFGVGTLEAMICGVPILGYNFGGQAEIITHKENGYLARVNDLDDLAEGLAYCLAHRERLGAAARTTVLERFQWHQVVEGYLHAAKRALQPVLGPTVSVVVTAFKLADYLPACIESVISQDYQDLELIIVDDASPDTCGQIAEEYAERDSRIRVIHNDTNQYLAESRNIGIRSARGKYLLPLDADDRLGPRAVGILARALDQYRDVDIATGSMEVYEEGKDSFVSGWPAYNPSFDLQIRQRNQVPYASMYRRWVWERTGGYRRRMRTAEDAEYWSRAMSFGAQPAKVTTAPTLLYTNRPESMSHSEATPNWNEWFTWSALPELTPFGASSEENIPVHSYDPIVISVIIPVGPGHDVYLQDCLDSLIAQTFIHWEAVVINDTGVPWYNPQGELINPYLQGFPFAKIVDIPHDTPLGPGWARNRGIEVSKGDLFVLLDADDYAQPLLLEALYKGFSRFGGWIYTDWFDQLGNPKEAKDWNADDLLRRQLGPITGIYAKEHWHLVEGFDEKIRGWEDWAFHLSLLQNGICGSRLEAPLFTYRYETGSRREQSFANKDHILQYIQRKYARLHTDGSFLMACRKCGNGGGKKTLQMSPLDASQSSPTGAVESGWVLIEYIGLAMQTRTITSKIHRARHYRYGADRRQLLVAPEDVNQFLVMTNDFRLVQNSAQVLAEAAPIRAEPAPMLRVERSYMPDVIPTVQLLSLPVEVKSILSKAGYSALDKLRFASDAELLSIKGIQEARLKRIRGALNAFLKQS